MADLLAALGLVFVIEGLIYGGFPRLAKRLAAEMQDVPDATLRYGGLGAITFGVFIVWLVRG
jgi:uncharacterized protein